MIVVGWITLECIFWLNMTSLACIWIPMRHDHIAQGLVRFCKTARPDSLVTWTYKPLYLWLYLWCHSVVHTSFGWAYYKTMQNPGSSKTVRRTEETSEILRSRFQQTRNSMLTASISAIYIIIHNMCRAHSKKTGEQSCKKPQLSTNLALFQRCVVWVPKKTTTPALAKANASEAWSMDFHTEGYQHVRTRESSTS